MSPSNKSNQEKYSWQQIIGVMNPLSTYRLPLKVKGNAAKKEKYFLLTLRVLQILNLATIPIAIVALTVILPRTGFTPPEQDLGLIAAMFYIASIMLFFIGYRWQEVYSWVNKHTNFFRPWIYDKSFMEVLNSHIFREANFQVVVLITFILGAGGANWFIITPLFIASAAAFILTFPTNNKWSSWKNEFEKSNELDG